MLVQDRPRHHAAKFPSTQHTEEKYTHKLSIQHTRQAKAAVGLPIELLNNDTIFTDLQIPRPALFFPS